MIILGTIVGILLFVAGCVGVALTWINYNLGSLHWIEGLLTFGVFALVGLAVIIMIVMTPKES